MLFLRMRYLLKWIGHLQKVKNRNHRLFQAVQVKLLPFFLDGVAGQKQLMQNDLIHPNAQAQSKLLNLAFPYIKGAL